MLEFAMVIFLTMKILHANLCYLFKFQKLKKLAIFQIDPFF